MAEREATPEGAEGSTVRRAIPEDAPRVCVHFETQRACGVRWLSIPENSKGGWRQLIQKAVEKADRELALVAEVDGHFVGFLFCAPLDIFSSGRGSDLQCVSVLSTYQGRGLGRELMTRLDEWARGPSCRLREITAAVHAENSDGMRLMERTGAHLEFKAERTRNPASSYRWFKLKLTKRRSRKEGTK